MIRTVAAALFFAIASPRTLDAQVLTVGETLGKGNAGLLLSDNVIIPGDGISNLNIAYGMFAKGLSDRLDLYLSAGEATTDGSTQAFVGGGWNVRLVRIPKATISFFNVATIPLNRRDEACRVLLNPALVVSAPVGAKLAVYSGLNALIPIGDRARGIFTPPSAKTKRPDRRDLRGRQMGTLGRGRRRQPQRLRRRPHADILNPDSGLGIQDSRSGIRD